MQMSNPCTSRVTIVGASAPVPCSLASTPSPTPSIMTLASALSLAACSGSTGQIGPPGAGPTGATGPGIAWRGDWSSLTSYAAQDAVQFGGSSWMAKAASLGETPTAGANWDLVAQAGAKGDTVAGKDGINGTAGKGE
jgi:hypothetical protein